MHEILNSPRLPKPRFHYTPVMKMGPFVRFSGMIAIDPETGVLESGGSGAQMARILTNLKAALPDLDLRLDQLVAARIFTTRFDEFPAINAAWEAELRELKVPPTRTSVGVVALPPRGRGGSRVRVLQVRSGFKMLFPQVKRAGDFIFVSGTSARRADDTVAGASVAADGGVLLDIREQTRAVIEHLRDILGSVGCELEELVSVTSYLANMRDFGLYNGVYGEYFPRRGPTRTTVAVHQLPHPHLLIEMRATAYKPVR